MSLPPQFAIGQSFGQGVAKTLQDIRDQQAIESILSQARNAQNASTIDDLLGQVISRVSPQNQQSIAGLLDQRRNAAMQQQERQRQANAFTNLQASIARGEDPFTAISKSGLSVNEAQGLLPFIQEAFESRALGQPEEGLDVFADQPQSLNIPQQRESPASPILRAAGLSPRDTGKRQDTQVETLPSGQAILSKFPEIQKQIQTQENKTRRVNQIDNEIAKIRSSPLSIKAKKARLEPLMQEKKELEKSVQDASKLTTQEEKEISDIRESGRKAQSAFTTLDRLEQLAPKVSTREPFATVFGTILDPGVAQKRARVERGIFTPEEQEFEQLIFSIVRDEFPTLPRIKTEFEEIMRRNPSILQTEAGNRAILHNIRQAVQFNQMRSQVFDQLINSGIPEKQALKMVDQIVKDDENKLISSIRNMKPQAGVSGPGSQDGKKLADKILWQ